MSSETEAVIELIDVDVPRLDLLNTVPAVHDVRWSIHRGDFWAVGALPGAGKTDLLCTTAALQRPLKGFHLLFGRNIHDMDEQDLVDAHRRVGMVFGTGRLFADLTVAENLSLPLAYHDELRNRSDIAARVDATLELTGLTPYRSRKPAQMTRNLHQRVGLARALVLNPEVLVIDNPLGGIDPRQGRWWLEFLCQLSAGHAFFEGKPMTIIVASDDLRPWLDVCRQFGIIRERRFEIAGGRDEVRSSQDPIVRELLMPAFTD